MASPAGWSLVEPCDEQPTNLVEVKGLKNISLSPALCFPAEGWNSPRRGRDFVLHWTGRPQLVGESGLRQTTAGRTLLGLYPATDGEICIDGHNLRSTRNEMMTIRRKAQIIFQDRMPPTQPAFRDSRAPAR